MLKTHASPLCAAVRKSIALRGYQTDLVNDVYTTWARGTKNVLIVLPTGGGKTVCIGEVVARHPQLEGVCLQAHRSELVGQLSLALARFGILHRVIAAEGTIKAVIQNHLEKVGTNFVKQTAPVAVASVDTVIRKGKLFSETWARTVTLVIPDEAHHVLRSNKWGRGVEVFPNPRRRLLLPTATPERADGKGLGVHAEGYAETMIEGPTPRELIDQGYLVDYKIVMPRSDVALAADMFSKMTGELNEKGKEALRNSSVVRDTVAAYLEYTPGKRALVFASEVSESLKMAAQFRDKGVRAMHLDGDTDDHVRDDAVKKFERGQLDVLVNVDLFGEGFDVAGVAAVYDASATESFARFSQRFGRQLRLDIGPELQYMWDSYPAYQRLQLIAESAKPHGVYVDLVGNLIRHKGPPDRRQEPWTLDSREKRSSGGSAQGALELTTCLNPDRGDGFACMRQFVRYKPVCPHCGYRQAPADTSTPKAVAGDLTLLDSAAVAELFGAVVNIDKIFMVPRGLAPEAKDAAFRRHNETVRAQIRLRDLAAQWAGVRRAEGLTDQEIYRYFFADFGLSWLEAFALPSAPATDLANRIGLVLTGPSF